MKLRRSLAFHVRLSLSLLLPAIFCSVTAVAMDWDTAAEVAACHRQPGYEKLAVRAGDLLREYGIHSMVMYFAKPDKSGIEALTPDPQQAGRWGLYVHVRDAAKARRLVASAIKDGLHISLSMKDPDPMPEVSAAPK